MYRLKATGTDVRECQDCGKAFFGNTTAVRCPDCRKAGRGEKKKRENIKSNPARLLERRIKGNVSKRRSKNMVYLIDYHAALERAIDDAKDTFTGEELVKRLKQIAEFDHEYCKLAKKIYDGNHYLTPEQIEQWKCERNDPFINTDPEQWLIEWQVKA